VLTTTNVPKKSLTVAEKAKARKIEITTGGEPKVVEAA
jgi:hypothetical protein